MSQRRRNYRKLIWWGAGVVLILLVVGIVIGVNSFSGSNDSGESDGDVAEQRDESTRDEKTEQEKKDEEVANQQKVIQYEGGDPNQAEELSGVITYAGVSGDVLMIRTSIDQYLTEGSCNLTLVRGGDIIYSDTANLVGDVSTASCEGFDVPTAWLGEGNIEISINLSADGREGTIRGEANV